ncbi:hypothetical protein HMPREF1982_04650 [Clostridiales bacterium oral taxon 876 str. F0540]|nr:hypothetical protein HMPREF1982_04650 [Clostridiales bacterium oral taxon 876 str. F0540]
MYFANKGISSFLVLALVIIFGAVLLNFLPFILMIAAAFIGVNYIVKAIKKWDNKKTKIFSGKTEKAETVNSDFSQTYTNGNVIDVEYTEIK